MPLNHNKSEEEAITTLVDEVNEVNLVPVLEPTRLRMNPLYSIYFNWFRFIVIGVIPFALLVRFVAYPVEGESSMFLTPSPSLTEDFFLKKPTAGEKI